MNSENERILAASIEGRHQQPEEQAKSSMPAPASMADSVNSITAMPPASNAPVTMTANEVSNAPSAASAEQTPSQSPEAEPVVIHESETPSAVAYGVPASNSEPFRENIDGIPEDDASPDSVESIKQALASMGVRQAVRLLSLPGMGSLTACHGLHNILPSPDNCSWKANDSFEKGDVVDLAARAFQVNRPAAAGLIHNLQENLSEDELILQSPGAEGELETPPVFPFPIGCLPPILRNMAEASAKMEGVDLALAAACVIGAASGCPGNGLAVESKHDKIAYPNLYFFIEAGSGVGKTGVGSRAFGPIRSFEKRLQAEFNEGLPMLKAKAAAIGRKLKALEQTKCTTPAEADANLVESANLEAAKLELEAGQEAIRIVTSDITSQKALELMSRNGGALMVLASDARSMANIIGGRHESGGRTDDALWVSAYSVVEDVDQDRISRPGASVARPCVALVLLIQPDIFCEYWKKDALLRGGLLGRCLTCRTASLHEFVSEERMEFPAGVAEAYEQRLHELLQTYRMKPGEPFITKVTSEALKVIIAYTNRTIERARDGEFSSTEQPFASRWAENAWRMALVFHAVEHGAHAHTVPVSGETARCAVAVVSWYAIQQMEILAEGIKDVDGDRTIKVLNLLTRGSHITASVVKKAKICPTTEEATALLDSLVEEGLLERLRSNAPGRPTVRYSRTQKNR